MAVVKLTKKGYGQLELNQVTFRRDGRIEAQCKLNATQFPADSTAIGAVAENGMLFAIDSVKRELKKATGTLAVSEVIGMNYTSEYNYDERLPQLRNFYLPSGGNLPRLGILTPGEKFHLNTICYDATTYTDDDGIKTIFDAGTAIYAGIASDGSGYWQLFATAPSAGPVARVIDYATMPDGQIGLKLQVIKG